MTAVDALPELRNYRRDVIRRLAQALNQNHRELTTGRIDAATYASESRRLWALAEDHRVSVDVYEVLDTMKTKGDR